MCKVSIIMPVFNDSDRLDKSINSFLNQSLKDSELICINDGSTDDSLKILNNFANNNSQIKVFTQTNQGSGKARNLGISKAQGEYIGFLDADDFFIDDYALERLYETANNNNAEMVTGNIKLVNSKDEYSPFKALKYYTDYEIIPPEEYGIPWSFYKSIYRTVFIRNNNIEFPDLLRGQDPVFLAEILSKVDKIYTVPVDVYAYFYVNGANQCNTRKKRFDHMMHYKMVFDYLADEKFDEIRHQFRYQMIGFIDMMGVEGGQDILDATREIFKDDSQLLTDFEESFYFKHKNDKLKELVYLDYKPRISVIVPVYNVSQYLDESINSLLNQTFNDFEVICVNDGSTDDSLAILNEFAEKDFRIKVIDKENGGCGSARNRGLTEANGDYIYFFDPDDYILAETFEELYKNAIFNDSDLVIFKIARFTEGKPIDYNSPGFDFDNVFDNVNFNYFHFDYLDIKKYVLNASFAPWTKLYKKEFLEEYNDFTFPLNVAFDDTIFHVKSILRAKKISFVPKFFYHYRFNPNSVNNTSSNGIDIFQICNLVEDFLKDNNYFKEFEYEFKIFKITQILNYLISSNSEKYFKLAKSNFSKIDFNDGYLKDNSMFKKYKLVLFADNLQQYIENLNKFELLNQRKQLIIENYYLKKEYNNVKKLNKEILNSKSWKLTNSVRKFRNYFRIGGKR